MNQRPGLNRRELLQVGYSGLLGLGLSSVLARRGGSAQAVQSRPAQSPKSVILIFLTGAPSHLDTFDLKPDAPAEIRGEFQPASLPSRVRHLGLRTPGRSLAKRRG